MAAQRAAAYADPPHNLGFVPDADLAQLDSGLEYAGQILYQLPEINPSVRCKIKENLIVVKGILCVDQLHLQAMIPDFVQTNPKRFLLLLPVCGFLLDIPLICKTNHGL